MKRNIKRYNVIHVSPNGTRRVIRNKVTEQEAYEVFNAIDNTFIEDAEMSFKELRIETGMSQSQFAEFFNISVRTIQGWDAERRQCPPYLIDLMLYKLNNEGKL